MKNLKLFLISVAAALFITGCQNTPVEEEGFAVSIAEDEVAYIVAENELGEEITAASFASFMAETSTKGDCVFFRPNIHFPECAEVSVSGTEFPKEIIIDFGDECLTNSGIVRSGKIYITITDKMINPGAEYSVIYEDVVFGERAIERNLLKRNEGQNDDGHWVMSYVEERTIYYGDSLVVKREYSGEKEWIDGFLTPEFADNKYYITGGGTITVNDDLTFEREIITPLFVDRACRFILSGVVEVTRGDEVMTIDFGDGTCDNIAVVTKDGESEEIELSSCKFKNRLKMRMRNMFRVNGWW